MAKSDNLRNAKNKKDDEFYTLLDDIETEISQHMDYVRQFEGKTVFCNCDDPEWSNFFVFFKNHFKQLKLKKMITTHYNYPIIKYEKIPLYYKSGKNKGKPKLNKDGTQQYEEIEIERFETPSYKIEWRGEMLNDDPINLITTQLKGNGDFCSDECVEILKEADIVVTNPPFSIARELYIPLLQKYNKKFVIIGDLNWVAYKSLFPLFRDNKIHFGYTNVKSFIKPDGTIQKFGNKVWFTNLDLDKTHEPLILTKNYYGNESRYPKYDNYDAIECGKVKDIPKDYFPCWYKCKHASFCAYAQTEGKEDKALCEQACNGEMGKHYSFKDCHKCNGLLGVPISYLANFCENQFRIMGQTSGRIEDEQIAWPTKKYSNPIQHKYEKDNNEWVKSNGSKVNTRSTFVTEHTGNDTYYTADNINGELKINYARILIQRKPIKE